MRCSGSTTSLFSLWRAVAGEGLCMLLSSRRILSNSLGHCATQGSAFIPGFEISRFFLGEVLGSIFGRDVRSQFYGLIANLWFVRNSMVWSQFYGFVAIMWVGDLLCTLPAFCSRDAIRDSLRPHADATCCITCNVGLWEIHLEPPLPEIFPFVRRLSLHHREVWKHWHEVWVRFPLVTCLKRTEI